MQNGSPKNTWANGVKLFNWRHRRHAYKIWGWFKANEDTFYFLMPFSLSLWTSLVAQMVKRLSTMWETWVRSLGREDSLEKEMAIHFSTIAWKIPWTEEPGRLQSMGLQRVGHDWAIFTASLCGERISHFLQAPWFAQGALNCPLFGAQSIYFCP